MVPVLPAANALAGMRRAPHYPSLAEAAVRLKPPPSARRLPSLILMTDRLRLADPMAAVGRLPRGAAVIVRDFAAADRARLAARLRPICRRRGVRLLIAGDWRQAATLRADGLHLPEHQLRRGSRPWAGYARHWLITAAAHSRLALRQAMTIGCDAALLSSVFPTASHPGQPVLGALRFVRLVRAAPLPVYALGGITAITAVRLAGSGAAGFAAIGGLSSMSRC